jgi:hypothetical protein
VAFPELELEEPDVVPELVLPDDVVAVEPKDVLATVVLTAAALAAPVAVGRGSGRAAGRRAAGNGSA